LNESAVLDVVKDVVKKVRPNAVMQELTSLPRHCTLKKMRAADERDRNFGSLVGARCSMRRALPLYQEQYKFPAQSPCIRLGEVKTKQGPNL